MDPLKLLTETLSPPWSYVLAVAAVVIVIAPRVIDLYAGWIDIRVGRRRLELERQRLELVKLRYEIEALRSAAPVPELDNLDMLADLRMTATMEQPVPARVSRASRRTRAELPRSLVLRWLYTHPRVGKLALPLLQFGFGLLLAMFGVMAVSLPITAASDPELGVGVGSALLLGLLYAVLGGASYLAFRRVRRTRLALLASQEGQDADGGG